MLEIEPALQLLLLPGDIPSQHFRGQELALGFLSARIANRPGRAARQRDGVMAEELETTEGAVLVFIGRLYHRRIIAPEVSLLI